MRKTQVVIVGGGPSGLLLSQLLDRRGVACVVLEEYSPRALSHVWKATRFSWWFTTLMHRFSDDPLARKLQLAEFTYLLESEAACRVVAENYAGLPFSATQREASRCD